MGLYIFFEIIICFYILINYQSTTAAVLGAFDVVCREFVIWKEL